MTIRKIIGLIVCLTGILIGGVLSGTLLLLLLAYWRAPENPGNEGNLALVFGAALGALLGFGIYKLGRKIAG